MVTRHLNLIHLHFKMHIKNAAHFHEFNFSVLTKRDELSFFTVFAFPKDSRMGLACKSWRSSSPWKKRDITAVLCHHVKVKTNKEKWWKINCDPLIFTDNWKTLKNMQTKTADIWRIVMFYTERPHIYYSCVGILRKQWCS